MDSIARYLGVIYRPRLGIIVNCIGCGRTDTESLRRSIQDSDLEFGKLAEDMSPLKTLSRPEEVASVIAFMASLEASWINAESFDVTLVVSQI